MFISIPLLSAPSTFNFSVPELSWLAAFLLFGVMIVLHFIPIRVLLLVWGIIKFSKRIIRPHAVTNNEVLDFLSRVPDDEEMVTRRLLVLIFDLLPTFSLSLFLNRFNSVSCRCNNPQRQHDAMHAPRRSNHRIMSYTMRLAHYFTLQAHQCEY